MTEQANEFFIREDGNDGYKFTDDGDPEGFRYIRADTVTPNEQVEQMMREAFVMGRQDRMESSFSESSVKASIEEIRRRYESSDSN